MTSSVRQVVEADRPSVKIGKFWESPIGRSQAQKPPSLEANNPLAANRNKKTKLIGGSALGLGLGMLAFKDGLSEGFKKIGSLGRNISSIFAIPATFLIPLTMAYGEYEELKVKNPTEQSSSRLIEIVYPILSIAFAPMTAFEPLEKATQSKGHMVTTLVNMPHIIFTFLSYTGGRFLTLLKSVRLAFFNPPDEERYRLENERKLVSTLGDIGSDNAAVTPEAHQFMTGILTIKDLLTGNFSSVKERLSEAPITTLLGTFIGSIFWIPTFIGKSFDTIIRTLEMSDQLKNALSEKHPVYKYAEKAKNWWHSTSAKGGFTGNLLASGREFGKIMQAVASPLGMVSVVFPAFDHFKKGFNNEEALEVGGSVKAIDKALNIGAFLGHLYFTTLYGAFVRLPQAIVTSTFYGCNIINRFRGVLDKPNDPRYIDPRKIRDKIFNPNKGWAKALSDFAGGIIEKNTGKKFLYDDIYKVIAEQECYRPLRESLYKKVFESEYQYEVVDDNTKETKTVTKEAYKDPHQKLWGNILKTNKEDIMRGAEDRFKKYLKEASGYDDAKINDFFYRYRVYDKIKAELEKLIDGEISACLESKESKLGSKNFFDMIDHPVRHWKDLKEISKFRISLSQFVVSPLNVLDFVNIVEMGDKNLPYWLSNWLLQESSIRIGDFKAGNYGELVPVYLHAVQTCGKGMAHVRKVLGSIFGMAA